MSLIILQRNWIHFTTKNLIYIKHIKTLCNFVLTYNFDIGNYFFNRSQISIFNNY